MKISPPGACRFTELGYFCDVLSVNQLRMKRRTANPLLLQRARNPFPAVDFGSFSFFFLVGRPVVTGAVFLCPLGSGRRGQTGAGPDFLASTPTSTLSFPHRQLQVSGANEQLFHFGFGQSLPAFNK
ncbi:hypothetical protein [Hymenobacter koreensis]|uniref:hypothetical protein n=1 Tax=Hymenobacter koreensis TaxID=1084523 RepID=UPI0031F1486D